MNQNTTTTNQPLEKMKRLPQPTDTKPEAYQTTAPVAPLSQPGVSLDAFPPSPIPIPEPAHVKPTVQTVPQAKYGSVNLKKYASFKNSRTHIKLQNQEALALEQLGNWISGIDVELNMMNLELFTDVSSFCQQFFIYGSKEERKASIDKVVETVLLPFCKYDKDMLDALLLSVKHRIVHSTKFSRRWSKIQNSFFFVLEAILWRSSVRR